MDNEAVARVKGSLKSPNAMRFEELKAQLAASNLHAEKLRAALEESCECEWSFSHCGYRVVKPTPEREECYCCGEWQTPVKQMCVSCAALAAPAPDSGAIQRLVAAGKALRAWLPEAEQAAGFRIPRLSKEWDATLAEIEKGGGK